MKVLEQSLFVLPCLDDVFCLSVVISDLLWVYLLNNDYIVIDPERWCIALVMVDLIGVLVTHIGCESVTCLAFSALDVVEHLCDLLYLTGVHLAHQRVQVLFRCNWHYVWFEKCLHWIIWLLKIGGNPIEVI